MSINFYLGDNLQFGKAPIFIKIQDRKFRISIRRKTGLSIQPVLWEQKNNYQSLSKLSKNRDIIETLALLEEIKERITQMHVEGAKITSLLVKDCIDRIIYVDYPNKTGQKSSINLYRYIDNYFDDVKNGNKKTVNGTPYKQGTINSIKQAIDHFRAYEKEQKRLLNFEDITMDFYYKYINFLTKRGFAPNTIGKDIKWLKTFLYNAESAELNHNKFFRDKRFRACRQYVDSIYLTQDDLKRIRSVDLSGKASGYTLARDIFFIGVLTAQRVSDYNHIKKEDFRYVQDYSDTLNKSADNTEDEGENEQKKYMVLDFIQQKTGVRVTVPCHPLVIEIMNKYNFNMPYLPEQKLNQYIKEIGKKAGLTEMIKTEKIRGGIKITEYIPKYKLITSHTARRTGATLMYLSGMEISDIMRITGHTHALTLMHYIKADKLEVARKRFHDYSFFKG